MNKLPFRQVSIFPRSIAKDPTFTKPPVSLNLGKRNSNQIPIPHRTLPEPKGQDLDFVNVVNSHLIHSDWAKLNSLANGLTAFRVKHVLLKIQKDYVVSLEFFNWVGTHKPTSLTLETQSVILHILTKYRKFKSAESILRKILVPGNMDLPSKLFEAILYSYRLCDSSPRVFDSLFKTFAHMKKFRNATDTFCKMKDYGFYPTVESCNAFLSSLLGLHRADVALVLYREMRRCRISPNVYTLNMVMCAHCRVGKLENAVEILEKMDGMGFSPTIVSYNTVIAGHCDKGLLSSAVKFKNLMAKSGLHPNVAALSNTGIPKVNVAAGAEGDAQPEVDVSDEEFLQFDTSKVPVIVTLTKVGRHYIVDATSEEGSQMSSAVSISVNSQGNICGLTKRGGAGLDLDLSVIL